MKSVFAKSLSRRALWLVFLLLAVVGSTAYFLDGKSTAQNDIATPKTVDKRKGSSDEPADLVAFREKVGKVTPVMIELKDEPGAVLQFNKKLNLKDGRSAFDKLGEYAIKLSNKQDAVMNNLAERKINLLMRQKDVTQIDGSVRHIEYRFTYLLNGFVAYVATSDLKRLAEQPEVAAVTNIENIGFFTDNSIDYSLGTQTLLSDRRFSVYGANQELTPQPVPGHPENPRLTAIDGFEGQGINLAVIDSGIDYRHPMFGGTGLTTPLPRVSGQPARSADNRKVIYFFAFSNSPGDPTDDFGHGTLVAATAAGFAVDGNTPANLGFGTGRDGLGVGPTLSGTRFHGTAPQARVMAYKVCGPSPNCLGDTPLSMEDAASPYTLIMTGSQGPTPVAKPVADVINLSLGDTTGSSTGLTSRAANNASLNGTIVVASAGNSGPGPGTIGSPSAATMAISVAASLDPGSVSGGDLLAGNQITNEICDGTPSRAATCDTGAAPAGVPPEFGVQSNANVQPATPFNFKLFPVAGGGDIRDGSVSGHYVYVDAAATPPIIPMSVTNRIAVVRFTGTFASGANPVAAMNPSAILLISATESATAVQVINGIPTYTISVANANILLDRLLDGEADGDLGNPPNGAVSLLPIRASEVTSLSAFSPAMAGFSSRGPNDNPTANFRQIKPDVTAPGVGINGAATPDGLPDDAVGLASTTGYTVANGTSFSGPTAAGAIAIVRQRVRNELGLDTTNVNDANYRLKRYDAVMVSRALLQNSATNLRGGFGVVEGDPAVNSSVNDLGSGHINVAGALALRAIMVSPTLLLADADPAAGAQPEFNRPTRNAPTLDAGGNLEVLLPTASFGVRPIAGLQTPTVATRKVIIRDVTRGGGGGVYNLALVNNRGVDGTTFDVDFLAADGVTSISSVRVPTGGQASFFVRTSADGSNIAPDAEFQWYVKATHATTSQVLSMPFYLRASPASLGGAIVAPNQTPITNVTTPQTPTTCANDLDGAYTINWTYTPPAGGVQPSGYRIQEATAVNQVFFDTADEPIANGGNTTFAASQQWVTGVNPATTSPAYFVPAAANQSESLTMRNQIALTGTGATLTFVTRQTLAATDAANIEISTNNGASYTNIAFFNGAFTGTRSLSLDNFVGQSIRLRIRFTSPLIPGINTNRQGLFVEDIRITTDNFTDAADVAATPLNLNLTRTSGTRTYRIAGLFATPSGNVIGPFSNTRCVAVP